MMGHDNELTFEFQWVVNDQWEAAAFRNGLLLFLCSKFHTRRKVIFQVHSFAWRLLLIYLKLWFLFPLSIKAFFLFKSRALKNCSKYLALCDLQVLCMYSTCSKLASIHLPRQEEILSQNKWKRQWGLMNFMKAWENKRLQMTFLFFLNLRNR